MGRRWSALIGGLSVGLLVGGLIAQQSISRHRRALFSRRSLRRLSALGFLSAHPGVETVRLLRDYVAWESQPMLRRRAEMIVRRMEAKLG